MPKVSIIGLGRLGLPLGVFLLKNGYTVLGSTTRSEKVSEIQKYGITPYILVLPIKSTDLLITQHDLFESDIIIITVPFNRTFEDPVTYLNWLNTLLSYIPSTAKIIFTSSTSVYPDTNQVWTEDMCISNSSDRSIVLQKAESLFLTHFTTTVCRLGGLLQSPYDLGKKLKDNTVIYRSKCPLNLIQIKDVITIIVNIIQKNIWNEVINCVLSDGMDRESYYIDIAKKGGFKFPVFCNNDNDSWKIVSNKKLYKLLPSVLSTSSIFN